MDADKREFVQFQFKVSRQFFERYKRYYDDPNPKVRHYVARTALEQLVTRQEGRDKKRQLELLASNKASLLPILQALVDSGELKLPEKS